MKYLLLLRGAGGGCDYTIGCNKTWVWLDATTRVDALQEAQTIVEGYSTPHIKEWHVLETKELSGLLR